MRPIVQSKKHIVQTSLTNIAQGAIFNITIVNSIEGSSTTPEAVNEGAIVKAVWVEMWLQNDSAAIVGTFTAGFYKLPGTATALTAVTAAALHDYANKKNIYYYTQGLAPNENAGILPLFKGWIKIPKGKQRMGLGDKLIFFVRNNNPSAIDVNICGGFLFKEYN